MLEIGLVIGSRCQEDDLRRLGKCCADGGKARLPELEEGLEAPHLGGAEGLGESAREHGAVMERIADAGRRLGAVGEDAPLAARQAHQIGGIEMQVRHAAPA